jgi:hypothetical protein
MLHFSHLQYLGHDLPSDGVLVLHDDPVLRVLAIPRGHSHDLVVPVSILARLPIRVAVVVNDSEAGPHNGLQWIIGVLFAEVGVVLGIDVLVDGGVLELCHHGLVFQMAILLAVDGLVQDKIVIEKILILRG